MPVRPRRFDSYRGLLAPGLFEEGKILADGIRGARVLQINATANGGGVAELLRGSVPLLNDLGLHAEWQILKVPDGFFDTTRRIHDGLQGGDVKIRDEEWDRYDRTLEEAAQALQPEEWDLIVVHDPQPAGIRGFVAWPGHAAWVWRCHIDTAHPNPTLRERLIGYVAPYDALVFTLPEYVFEGCPPTHTTVLPGIDPESPKNEPIRADEARRIVEAFDIDPDRPLVTQVSRFDEWKDPLGVLQSFRAAHEQVPGLQLALVGETADDDPAGGRVLAQVQDAARGVRDVHVIADEADDIDVNAFQTVSTAIVQKSIREGFGLTVSEALWSGTPVIGGRAGGIPHQIQDGTTGYLVDSVEETAKHIAGLARDPALAAAMGQAGREDVRRRFLLPRMIRDDLRLWGRLLEARQGNGAPAAMEAP